MKLLLSQIEIRMSINWNVSCWIFSVTDNPPAVSTAQAAHARCTSVEFVRSAIGAEERGWRPPTFHGHTVSLKLPWWTRNTPGTGARHCGSSTEWKNGERERAHTKGRRGGDVTLSWAEERTHSVESESLHAAAALHQSASTVRAERNSCCREQRVGPRLWTVLHDTAASTLQWEHSVYILWMTAIRELSAETQQSSDQDLTIRNTDISVLYRKKSEFFIWQTIDYSPASFCITLWANIWCSGRDSGMVPSIGNKWKPALDNSQCSCEDSGQVPRPPSWSSYRSSRWTSRVRPRNFRKDLRDFWGRCVSRRTASRLRSAPVDSQSPGGSPEDRMTSRWPRLTGHPRGHRWTRPSPTMTTSRTSAETRPAQPGSVSSPSSSRTPEVGLESIHVYDNVITFSTRSCQSNNEWDSAGVWFSGCVLAMHFRLQCSSKILTLTLPA